MLGAKVNKNITFIGDFIMKMSDVINYFGTQKKACEAIGTPRASFTEWKDKGYLPFSVQARFYIVTGGELEITDVNKYRKGKKLKRVYRVAS